MGQKINLWVQGEIGVVSDRANQLTGNAVDLFNGMLEDLNGYWWENDKWWHDRGYDNRGQYVIIHDDTLPRRFRKQLAIGGVLTRTQYCYLNKEQLDTIHQVRVPRIVCLPIDHEDSLWIMLQQVKEATAPKTSQELSTKSS